MEGCWLRSGNAPPLNLRAQIQHGHFHGVCNLGHLQQHHPHPAGHQLSAWDPTRLSWVLLSSLLPTLSHIHLPLSWGQDRSSLTLALASSPSQKFRCANNSIEPQAGHARYGGYYETTSVEMSFTLQLIPNLQSWHAQSHAVQADFTPVVTLHQHASGVSCALNNITFILIFCEHNWSPGIAAKGKPCKT